MAQLVKNPLAIRRPGFDPGIGKIPWSRERLPTPVSWPGEFHGQRSLAGYSPRGCKKTDVTEQLSLLTFISKLSSVQSLSCVRLCATPSTAAHQASLLLLLLLRHFSRVRLCATP